MNADTLRQVRAWYAAHENEIIEQLKTLVSIPSVTQYDEGGYPYGSACHTVMDAWQRMAESMGFATERFGDHAVSAQGFSGEKTLGLFAHLDVVPVGNGWQYSPFQPVREGDFLIGRGADDNKSAAVGALYLMKCLKELKIPLSNALKIYAGCDEECGSRGIAYFAAHHPCPDVALIPDCSFPVCHGEKGIINVTFQSKAPLSPVFVSLNAGEASNVIPDIAEAVLRKTEAVLAALPALSRVLSAEETETTVKLTSQGRGGHAAFPQGSDNAVKKLTDALIACGAFTGSDLSALAFLSRVNEDYYGSGVDIAMEDIPSGKLSCVGTVLRLEGGFPSLTANIRYPVTAKGEAIHEALKNAAGKAGFALSSFHDSAPNFVSRETELVKRLTKVYQEITGDPKEPYVMSGGTYARELPNAVGFGIGGLRHPAPDSLPAGHGGAHQPDEVLYVPSYLEALAILTLGVIEADACLNEQ